MELVAAVAGALILVETVTRVRGALGFGEAQYGWVMAAYGLGATLASLVVGGVRQNWVNLPTETLLAEWTEEAAQGRVYGAHFAWGRHDPPGSRPSPRSGGRSGP